MHSVWLIKDSWQTVLLWSGSHEGSLRSVKVRHRVNIMLCVPFMKDFNGATKRSITMGATSPFSMPIKNTFKKTWNSESFNLLLRHLSLWIISFRSEVQNVLAMLLNETNLIAILASYSIAKNTTLYIDSTITLVLLFPLELRWQTQ